MATKEKGSVSSRLGSFLEPPFLHYTHPNFGVCGLLALVWLIHITICLRVIRNAWHFYYALRLVFKVVCGSFGIALLTP
ncbi:hypothetical protein THOB06_480011 [Vibrio rotiferianus]|nr:hypothetical protein THOB06_480011 [Vibrio rotiferianus]